LSGKGTLDRALREGLGGTPWGESSLLPRFTHVCVRLRDLCVSACRLPIKV